MARRSLIIGLFVVLAQLAMGCQHGGTGEKRLHRKHLHHEVAEPCACANSSSSGSLEPPILPAESIPAPKKMPATSMNNSRVTSGFIR